ncbi:MAG: YabP/YqfC family sporulation protein [Oscillospiraceae bacterium]|nr:YabP/YqfC family sporulation protein [Oscillospiraceae bacterium]
MNKHILVIENRNSVNLSGVKKADSFSPLEIAVYTEEGDLLIRGKELVVEEFNETKGELKINGRIDSLSYRSDKQHIPDNFLSRLFR